MEERLIAETIEPSDREIVAQRQMNWGVSKANEFKVIFEL